jgi:2-dehydropantoate 2-reductase
MREAMTNPDTYQLVVEILKEGIQVAEAAGYRFPPDFLEFCIQYLNKAGYHKPSMRVDVEAGRKTEIDYLSRKIVQYGQKHGIPTPVNSTVTRLIKGVEHAIEETKKRNQ